MIGSSITIRGSSQKHFGTLVTLFPGSLHLRFNFVSLATVVVLSLPSTGHAYFPFITDDTGTQGQGGNQLEINYVFTKERGIDIAEDGTYYSGEFGTRNVFPITYTRGLTEDLDVFVGIIRQTSPINGWMNAGIGFKWTFAGDQEEGWSFAIKPLLLTPVGRGMQASGLGNGLTNGSVSIISSYVKPQYEIHINGRYISNRAYGDPENQQAPHLWGVSVAPIWVLNHQWKLGVDAGLETNPNTTSSRLGYAQIGAVYAPVENVQIGLGLIGIRALGSTSKEYNWSLMSGITWQF